MSDATGLEIAVIGYACRLPGAPDAAAFWRNLVNGVCSVRSFSERELQEAGVEEAALKDGHYVRARCVVDEAEAFDASFFGYSPRQAQLMDPQFRLLHECAWTCLEHAGIDPFTTAQSVGLYAGAADNTWWNALSLLNRGGSESEQFASEQLCNRDFLCTLVAHRLHLRGPAVVIQSACSTSLLAVHAACRALLTGECRVALAGGVALSFPRNRGYAFEEGMIFSPSGVCRPFDAGADGTLPGEGVGLVALKPLKNAVADGDSIHAVIRATAANNDGNRKAAYTAPSVEAQAEAIRTALHLARTPAETIGYLEAHGTATPLGDPVEIAALARAFDSKRRGFCRIGSVKSNIGHLDTAAGIAGLLKAVLALEFDHIPKSLHYRSPNPAAGLSETPFRVAGDGMEWPSTPGAPRRAGVSSFGIGGTNVHAVLEEAPAPSWDDEEVRPQLLVFSARSPAALARLTARLAEEWRERPDLSCADVAATLQTGRAAFAHRATVVVLNLEQAVDALEGRGARRLDNGQVAENEPVQVFMFPGQGSQHIGMGASLYDGEPVFRQHLDRCFDVLAQQAPSGLPWRGFLAPPDAMRAQYEDALRRTEVAQPLIFAVEYAMAQLALSLGLKPTAMIGHSLGEYTAACLAGVFTVEEALNLLACRGRLMGALPSGSMLGISAPLADLSPLLAADVSLAAINGIDQHVVSGPSAAIAALEVELKHRGFRVAPLDVSHAFHSAMMAPILDEFAARVAELDLKPPRIPFISCVSGNWIAVEEATDPAYWVRQLRHTVNFAGGLDTIFAGRLPALIEIGPGGALSALARQHRAPGVLIQPTMRHRQHEVADRAFLLEAVANLWRHGIALDWRGLHRKPRRKVALPGYPFERTIHTLKGDPARLLQGLPAATAEVEAEVQLHGLSWRRTWPSLPGMPSPGAPSPWLIFTGDPGLGRSIAGVLQRSGYSAHLLEPDASVAARHLESRHIVFVASNGDSSAEAVISRGVLPLTRLLRTLDAQQWPRGGCLTVVTTAAFSVSGAEACRPAGAMLAGVCQAAAAEYPQWSSHAIDVDRSEPEQRTAELIVQIASREAPPPRSACRGGMIWEPVHDRLPTAADAPSLLRSRGAYVITGGLGGIGMTLASRLVRDYQAGLALVSRTALRSGDHAGPGLSDGAPPPLILAADVSDSDQMRDVFARVRRHFGRIDGVIHAAGVPGGRLLVAQDDAGMREAMRAKVQGTLVVESLLDDGAFLALMSSADAWNPGPGQTAYAAANTFLDAFAVHRRSLGKPVVSINWDRWLGVGMAERFARSAGVPLSHGLTPEQGYDAFRAAMQTANPNVLVSKGAWQARPRPAAASAASAAVASGDASHVSKKIREVWKSLFGVDDVDANQNFFELGATSLDIVQLTARIRASLACEIAPTVLYNHPNINALAHHLAEPAAGVAPVEETVRRPRNLLTQRARAGTRS